MGRAGVAAIHHSVDLPDGESAPVRHASEPPEARGLRRDDVRLMVSRFDGTIAHTRFHQLPGFLRTGDLLVVNASRTLEAALPGRRTFGMRVDVHLSTELPGGLWVVEIRQSTAAGSKPLRLGLAGEVIRLPEGARVSLLAPYPFAGDLFGPSRLWTAALELPLPVHSYLDRFGSPIRYGYVPRPWPIADYQTMFATEPGSAEMPSAGRPFTPEVVQALQERGIAVAPIVLHTGVASPEDHEPPYEERYAVPRATADAVNRTRQEGGRVIAVGTTVVRALETVTDDLGVTHPGRGWTNLVITGTRVLRATDGLITGLHEPRATHLAMIRAVASRSAPGPARLLDDAYREAVAHGYLWHEFGDVHLLIPS
jgi:S-adenosylmethionine:tRNA ribosyltransferase-isomerase